MTIQCQSGQVKKVKLLRPLKESDVSQVRSEAVQVFIGEREERETGWPTVHSNKLHEGLPSTRKITCK